MKNIIQKIINCFFHIFPINDKKILFECGRNKIDDNPLAIYEYMKKEKLDRTYKLVFLASKGSNTSALDSKDTYYYRTFLGMYHKATAKYWIRSQSIGGLIEKRKGQIVLYTNHGIVGLKKCGYDVTNAKERPPISMTKGWDYFIASSKSDIPILKSSTGYQGKILSLGSARTDKLINIDSKRIQKIKKDLGLTNNKKKVILYAPTFRDYEDSPKNWKINDLSKLKDYKIVVTCHPLARKLWEEYPLDKSIINALDYEIDDLLLISDVLITDYSSVFFDYLLLNKPIVFYPYDYDKYVKERKGFYFDYKKDLPGAIAYNIEELLNILKNNKELHKYDQKRRKFRKEHLELCDGNSCQRIVEKIINKEL